MVVPLLYSGWYRREISLNKLSLPHSSGNRALTNCSPFSSWERTPAFSSSKLCCLGGRVTLAKFLLFTPVHPNSFFLFCLLSFFFFFFLLQQSAETFPLETRTSTKALSYLGFCPGPCSPGAPRKWLRGTEASSQAPADSPAHTNVCLPITWCTGGQGSSWVPRCIAGSHNSHKDAFVHGWTPNCCCWEVHKWGTLYSAMLPMFLSIYIYILYILYICITYMYLCIYMFIHLCIHIYNLTIKTN